VLGVDPLGHRPQLERAAIDLLEAGAAEIHAPEQHVRRVGIVFAGRGGEPVVHVPLEGFREIVLLRRFVAVVPDLDGT
jgi:hypothetical protein